MTQRKKTGVYEIMSHVKVVKGDDCKIRSFASDKNISINKIICLSIDRFINAQEESISPDKFVKLRSIKYVPQSKQASVVFRVMPKDADKIRIYVAQKGITTQDWIRSLIDAEWEREHKLKEVQGGGSADSIP